MMSKNARFLVMAAIGMLLGSGLQASAADSIPVLHGMVAEAGSHGPVIHLQGTGKLDTVHYSPQPGVWVVEMPEVEWHNAAGAVSRPELGVERAELSQVEEFGKRISRLTVWLTVPAQLQLVPQPQGLDLIFTNIVTVGGAPEKVSSEDIPVPVVNAANEAEDETEPAATSSLEPEAEPGLEAARSGANLLEVVPVRSGDAVVVELKGDGSLQAQAFALTNPTRLVIDLPGVVNRTKHHVLQVGSPLVRRVRVAQFRATPDPVTRIVVDLERDTGHSIVESSTGATILVGGNATPASAATVSVAASELTGRDGHQETPSRLRDENEGLIAVDPYDDVQVSEAEAAVTDTAAVPAEELGVQDLPAEVMATGQVDTEPRVVSISNSSGELMVSDSESGQVATEEPGSTVSASREVMADDSNGFAEYSTPLISNESGQLTITRAEGGAGMSEPLAPTQTGVMATAPADRVSREDLLAENQPITGDLYEPEPIPRSARSPWVADPSQLIERAPVGRIVRTQSAGGEQFESTTVETQEKRYSGDPISLTLKDADIKDVLRTFSTLTNLNIVQDNVSGSVTVDLRNVPWDQALDLILKVNDLGYVLENNVLRVAPLSKLRNEREAQAELLKGQEEVQPITTVVKPLSYARAGTVSNLLRGESFLLSSRGSVVVDARTNTLIIRDAVDRVEGILRLIEHLDQPTTQVVIEGRIVETTRDFSQEIGISWGFQGNMIAESGTDTGLVFPNEVTVDGAVNLARGNINGVLGFTFADIMDTFNLDFLLTAAESDGLVKIVSTPRVTTQNLTQAQIQSGYQLPVQQQVNNTVTVQYISATLRLQVTPQITAEGTVILDLNIQKQEPLLGLGVAGATNVPIFTRDAQTQLLVRDGGTTVIAGIYQINDQESQSKVPVLSKIPVLGHLFKNSGFFKRHDELLIFITPRIVKY
jgi:type IV pilus assembly protein PilQ